jgi:transcriptional regulator with XRE-family HTH domain
LSPKGVGAVIKAKRLALGMTQEQLANTAGVTKNYVTMVEAGTRKGVSFMVRLLLAETLGIEPSLVLDADERRQLSFLENALTLGAAETFVWSLTRWRDADMKAPTGSKFGAQVAIRRVLSAHPERKEELANLRRSLNRIYRQ